MDPMFLDRLGISGGWPELPVMAWRSDLQGSRDWQSPAWGAFTGRALRSAQRGHTGWTDCMHPADRERCDGVFRACAASGAPFSVDYRLRRYDGSYRWVMDCGFPQHTDDVLVGYTGSCVDIHARRMSEDCLAERMRVLRLNERRRDAHLSELARDLGSLTSQTGARDHGALTSSELLERLHLRLKDALGRVEALVSSPIVEPGSGARLVRVVDVINVAMRHVDAPLTHSGHRLRVDLPEPDMLLYGDSLELGRAIASVVEFVGDACKRAAQISMTVRHDDDAVYLRIRRSDEAKEPDFVPRAFELARRIGAARAASAVDGESAVHALQEARRVARLHGGELLATRPAADEWVMRVALRR